MALVNRIFSLTQSDLPKPQGTTRQAGDYPGNSEILNQPMKQVQGMVQYDKVKK